MPPLLHRQAEAGRHRRPGGALRAPVRAPGQEVAGLSGSQLDAARAAKLRALVGSIDPAVSDGSLPGAPTVLPGGAAVVAGDGRAFVLIDDGEVARFGPAMAWARRAGATSLDVVVDGSPLAAGVVARRAACFADPPGVWSVAGRAAVPVGAGDVPPAVTVGGPVDGPAGVPAERGELAALLGAHGLEVVWEHGVLRGEVLGLEVARTVGDHLEVGVGRHDRMARLEMRPSETLDAALESAAGAVRRLRRPGAPVHPANTLARSRWLRSVVVAGPEAVGCRELRSVEPPLAWWDLPEAGAAPALGRTSDGDEVVVVCSVGVDLDLVPTAADARLLHAPSAGLLLVVPAGDDVPANRELAGRLARPAEVLAVGRDWAGGLSRA